MTSTNLRFGRKPCCPVGSDEHSLTVAGNGPVLLQDAYLIEKLAHFVRERIPDRVYHDRSIRAGRTNCSGNPKTACSASAIDIPANCALQKRISSKVDLLISQSRR